MPRIRHYREHLTGMPSFGKQIQLRDELEDFLNQMPGEETSRKSPPGVRPKILPKEMPLLLRVAEWVKSALDELPLLSRIEASTHAGEQLVSIVHGLSEPFAEQKAYLLQHANKLKDIGSDPRWPPDESQRTEFIAESIAGAEWGLTPSTSREYIRKQKS